MKKLFCISFLSLATTAAFSCLGSQFSDVYWTEYTHGFFKSAEKQKERLIRNGQYPLPKSGKFSEEYPKLLREISESPHKGMDASKLEEFIDSYIDDIVAQLPHKDVIKEINSALAAHHCI